ATVFDKGVVSARRVGPNGKVKGQFLVLQTEDTPPYALFQFRCCFLAPRKYQGQAHRSQYPHFWCIFQLSKHKNATIDLETDHPATNERVARRCGRRLQSCE